MPTVERVSEDVVGYDLDHKGLIMNYRFYSKLEFLGSVKTELWNEDNLLLVHHIEASTVGVKYGTAMIDWLVRNSSETIQPVHVIMNGLGFWAKLKEIWPDRIYDLDLRSSEYDLLLEKRKHYQKLD
ncbi:hypothetical protein TUM4438_39950 [Shewanella sairae]|uniref:Uncharacterized protein n=1 Tax=Shewanella sairae TaxID=190310 RepID=A0ABQ4PQH1_9GAMM|nr:hypothetical protein [Shewanella sairae]MCL1132219.1 hypothetical protein [Shewanella sairae]GIU51190.1 hypothetical protein TUM4438_39950 [Shewanella sairae]